jgi:hypothetical protein
MARQWRYLLLLAVLVWVQLGSSRVAWAWNLTGHRLIALDALTALPSPMREALTPHASALLAGLLEPDFNRLVSHKIPIISLRGTAGRSARGAAGRSKRLHAGNPKVDFSSGQLRGEVDRKDEHRIYMAVWEHGLHKR